MSESKNETSGIFSVRLVIADFYMEKPISGFDPCYSEFRGRDIKRVPIIRVFGSNADGLKTCMHIHGVFPYFYIPYEAKEFESLNKAIYQIATNVDKAINISLGQACSSAQHVFKIQPVKGIPFYGYHAKEHQFLKIYMFNPRFVRRAANLLQSGSVMNKNFHPFESHVPYILQFMIDYNLYGMSFVHVPIEIVKFRQKNENYQSAGEPQPELKHLQILSPNVATKQSTCAIEIDIGSNFILNRFQLVVWSNNVNKHSNPGIEAIWNDERLRREKMAEKIEGEKIPALEIPESQDRTSWSPTESDIFHRTVLQSKLLALDSTTINESQCDQSINLSATNLTLGEVAVKDQKRTFNLRQIIGNAIYPEECTQNENLIDASFIENHVSNSGLIANNSIEPDTNNEIIDRDDSIFSDDTVVDEDLLSAEPPKRLNSSLCAEDMELLDILQQLEEHEEVDHQIDLDSTLAPLTQTLKKFEPSPDLLDKQVVAAAMSQPLPDSDNESDTSVNGNQHDFSIVLEDMNEFILKFTPSQNEASELAQVDGSDDLLPKTPTKSRNELAANKTKNFKACPRTPKTPNNRANISPKRSPRTPKQSASNKYAPLPLKITSRNNEKTLVKEKDVNSPLHSVLRNLDLGASDTRSTKMTLSKKLALNVLRRKSVDVYQGNEATKEECAKRTPIRRSRNTMNLDKTHITCELTPRRKSERILKVYSIEEDNASKKEGNQEIKKMQVDRQSTSNMKNFEVQNSQDIGKETQTFKLISSNSSISKDQQKPLLKSNKSYNHHFRKCVVKICKNTVLTKNLNQHKSTENNTNKECEQQKPVDSITSIQQNSDESDEIEASDTEDTSTKIAAKRLRRSFHIAQRMKMIKNGVISNKDITHSPIGKVENKNELTSSPTKSTIISEDVIDADDMHIHIPYSPAAKVDNKNELTSSPAKETTIDEDVIDVDDMHIQSFYDASFTEDFSSPINSNEIFAVPQKNLSDQPFIDELLSSPLILEHNSITASENVVQITPLNLPPTYDEVLTSCKKLDIPEYEFEKPFYGDPDDITRLKEVGHIVLNIPGNKLNDCDEFQSVLGEDLKGLSEWRRQKFITINGPSAFTTSTYRNTQRIREYFAKPKNITIVPQISPPTRQDAKLWLKARNLLINGPGENRKISLEESPIKIKRQKITMSLNNDNNNDEDDDNANVLDDSTNILSLTPPTPFATTSRSSKVKGRNDNAENVVKLKSRTRCAKLSLNRKLMGNVSPEFRLQSSSSNNSLSGNQMEKSMNMLNSEKLSASIDSTISSQTVFNAMKRNSFIKELQDNAARSPHELSFGLSSASLDTTFGFKVNLENLQQAKSDVECNYVTTIILELFVPTRGNLLPDPIHDEVRCIFYAIEHRSPATSTEDANKLPRDACGCIIVKDMVNINNDNTEQSYRMFGTGSYTDITMRYVNTEIEVFETLVELCMHWDPDIYGGYEIETTSWGYILERSKQLGFNIAPLLSRVPTQKVREYVDEDREHFTDLDIEMKLCGRILLDVWRLMRSEIALTSYTFENVIYHVLHKRCPYHSHRALTEWFDVPCTRWIVIDYYIERVKGTLALLDQLDLIGRTSEMAKLIGIQFYEVLSRGSQFRVESMMLRIAKPRNLVPLSPSVQQRAHMRAPEYLPLILEPQSRFYVDPVIVLDFQSLYPSMIIAYNYCFSTCLGRVEHLGHSTPFEFGASQLRVSPAMLRHLIDNDLITISPCGVVFVKSSVREGVLPRMLCEILDTRQMVKQSMKLDKSNSALQRVLHSRQFGLKLMANVTYGYTAANFSGRMPCVEVGDSVVAKGRETLERAIRMVESNEKWRVRVVYGDTDSLFVQVPGRNREEAFKIGAEIAEAVTKDNPKPVKLKLEKVYQPCILQTKKRYVGYMYETAEQKEPIYEAKGIETVRRDGCPAVAKMLEKVLRILFETTDVSQIKKYVCRQFSKLLAGRANLQDLIFAKEFRGLNGYKPTACVPALELTRRWIQTDPRRVPRCGERVPFIIVNGPPGVPLIRLVRSPHEVLADEGLKINAIYYITKAIIPPLNRCLLLIGADVNEWFATLPRKLLIAAPISTANKLVSNAGAMANHQSKKSTISQYFSVTNCITDCGRQTKRGICDECTLKPQRTFVVLHGKIAKIERGYQLTQQICQACCGRGAGDIKCNSLDCPVLYVGEVKRRELKQIEHMRSLLLAERF